MVLRFGSVNSVKIANVKVPANYPLYFGSKRISTIGVNQALAKRVEAALNDIINHYGADIEKVAPAATKYARLSC